MPFALLACALVATAGLSVAAVPGFTAVGIPGWLAAAAGGGGMAAVILAEFEAADRGGRVPLWAPVLVAVALVLGDVAAVRGTAKAVWFVIGVAYVVTLGLMRRMVLERAHRASGSSAGR